MDFYTAPVIFIGRTFYILICQRNSALIGHANLPDKTPNYFTNSFKHPI
jgi:hypothetical protein